MEWVTLHAIAISSALLSAFWAAVGIVVRQRVARGVADTSVTGAVVRQPLWWAGTLAAAAGYVFQALALAHGSLLLVQPLLVSSLLFALPIYARLTHDRVTRWEWLWAAVLAVALAVVVIVGDPAAGHARGSLDAWTVVALVMGPLLALCVLGARIWRGRPPAPVLLAVVAGSSLALFAVLTKGVVVLLGHHGFGAVLAAPEFYAWILAALAGMVFQQSAFRAGALTASLPTMYVAKPMVASVLGVGVLGETLNADGPEMGVLAAAVVVAVVATAALARGEAATIAAGAASDVKIADRPSPGVLAEPIA